MFFFCVITKLGDPIIIDDVGSAPASLAAVISDVWPVSWGYWLLAPLLVLGLALANWKKSRFRAVLLLPLAWLLWQFIAATGTIDGHLTELTLRHFTACVVLFYLGYFGLHQSRWPWPLLVGLSLAFCFLIRSGFEQHFGGLEATRKYVHQMYPNWSDIAARNPDFAKRIDSPRIFAVFVSPNALAGSVLLFLPMTLVFMWQLTPKVSPLIRRGFLAILGLCGLAILFWTGSKAGWLVALVMAVVAALFYFHNRLPVRLRVSLVSAFLVLGLVGFSVRFSHYFQRGATSVSARFDYWKAAGQTIASHPVLGTGPGTFGRAYSRLKAPNSEPTRLCHNDYLEQGSDSGAIGLLTYSAFIFGVLFSLYRYRKQKNCSESPIFDAASLGLLGLCLQSFVEYHLYIPALSWPMFFLLGWLLSLSQQNLILSLKL